MRKDLFPNNPERVNAFTEAQAFFATPGNEAETKMKGQNSQNSFIKDGEGNIYMLAKDTSTPDHLKNTAYLGHGSFASVKLAIDKDGNLAAVRIEYKTEEEVTPETEIGKEAGLVKGTLTRASTSVKSLGFDQTGRDQKLGVYKEYQIQKLGGISLSQFMMLQKDNLTPNERFRIAIRVASKISELHQLDIAHLDLKPDNVMIDPKTHEVTIIDFGFAEKKIDDKLTAVKGTQIYLPISDLKISKKKLDIHALIKTLYFPIPADDTDVVIHQSVINSEEIRKKKLFGTSVLKSIDFNHPAPRDLLYDIGSNHGRNYLMPRHFKSAEDLACILILKRHGIKAPYIESETKRAFLEIYDGMISDSIKQSKPLEDSEVEKIINRLALTEAIKNGELLGFIFEVIQGCKKLKASFFGSENNDAHRVENYEILLRNAKTSFEVLVITYALLSAKNPSTLEEKVTKKMGFSIVNEAKGYIEKKMKGAIAAGLVAEGVHLSSENIEKRCEALEALVILPIMKYIDEKASAQKKQFDIPIENLRAMEESWKPEDSSENTPN
ncbi:MAG: protein kinase [Gammaproteobacteria bacterium]|nr:protein kinase [Gammaproteobacteria bacterium]